MAKSFNARWNAVHKLFRDLIERKPRNGEINPIVDQTGETDLIFTFGDIAAITYVAPDGKTYYHEFAKNNRPALYTNHDGKQLYIFGGKYKVTQQGIIG